MDRTTLESVLSTGRLPGDLPWSMPILLAPPGPVNAGVIDQLSPGDDAALLDGSGRFFALLHVEEKFRPDKKAIALGAYGTVDPAHPNVGDLEAAGDVALGGWSARITDLTAGIEDPVDLLVEAVAYLVERLPEEPLLMTLLETERTRFMSQQMVLGESITRSRVLLEHTDIDWAALGYRGKDFDDLVEYLLRIIASMVLVPSDPPRSASELRAVLRHWIGPVVTTPPRSTSRRHATRARS